MLENAEALINDNIDIYKSLGDFTGLGTAYRYLGTIAQLRHDVQAAQGYFEQALKTFDSFSGWENYGALLSSLGILFLQQKDTTKATRYQSRRLSLAEAFDDREGMAVALYNLGRLSQIQSSHSQAIAYYERCLQAASIANKQDTIAASQWRISWYGLSGQVELDRARYLIRQACRTFDKLGGATYEVKELNHSLHSLSFHKEIWLRTKYVLKIQ